MRNMLRQIITATYQMLWGNG